MTAVEFAIVGAGPAGMAAAVLAAELGLDTMLVDEQAAPGGQIYRAIERVPSTLKSEPPGMGRESGQALIAAFRAARIDYRPATSLWHIDRDGGLYLVNDSRCEKVAARRVLLATGAIERPVPIPGWTLPGVMTAGAAQVLLKTADLVPDGRAVLAGQGPLLYLLAAQLAAAGASPTAILETTPAANWLEAARRLDTLWPGRGMLIRGLRLVAAVKRARVPICRGVSGLKAIGRQSLERVVWDRGEIAADILFLHEGVIPNVQISLAVQLRHEWDIAQLCWRPALDPWGRTSLPGIAIAGDSGGIAGADAAVSSGQLATLDAATVLGRIGQAERDRRARPIREALASERALRPFLDRLYRPPRSVLLPTDDEVIACRCEEVTIGEVRRAARLGAMGPNQLKAFTRCGMGPCQGRICGPVVAAVMADVLHRSIADIGTFRPRAPLKPITVGMLADFAGDDSPASSDDALPPLQPQDRSHYADPVATRGGRFGGDARMPESGNVMLYASVGPELAHYEVDVDNATLTKRDTVTLPANVHYAWPHASRRYLYVASSNSASGIGGVIGDRHHVTALRIDSASGTLSPHGAPIALPTRPIHLTSDIPSEHLLVAFSNPSGLRVYRVNTDMTPGAEIVPPAPIDPGIYGHQVRVSLDNRLVILVTRGHDLAGGNPEQPGALKVFAYRGGLLSDEVSIAPEGGYGFGPRHLDFHPSKPWVYVSLERQNRLDMFALAADRLSPNAVYRKGTLAEPGNIRGRQAAGTVHVHPNGRFVYVANRASSTAQIDGRNLFVGGENTLAVFAIDPATGEPNPIQHIDTHGIHCRTFHIDPSGRLLAAAHIMALPVKEGTEIHTVPASLALFRIDTDGKLAFARKYDVEVGDRQMFWMGMVPRG